MQLTNLSLVLRRNIGASSMVLAKGSNQQANTDPVTLLFLDKLKEYKEKAKKTTDGKLIDSTPEIEANVKAELDNLKRRYGGGNLEEFPKFSFEK